MVAFPDWLFDFFLLIAFAVYLLVFSVFFHFHAPSGPSAVRESTDFLSLERTLSLLPSKQDILRGRSGTY